MLRDAPPSDEALTGGPTGPAMASRLALGTVQFGIPYGVSNSGGQVPAALAERILATAAEAGIDTLDTASAYGDSEAVLGAIGVARWKVVTKLPPLPPGTSDPTDWVMREVEASLQRLRVDRLAGLMLHRSGDLTGAAADSIHAAMIRLRDQGIVGRIGYSIYAPAELDALFARYPADLVQAPLNVVDRRLDTSGWLRRLDEAGVEIHTRSAFLQGLLLMRPEARPPAFARWNATFDAWDRAHQGQALATALGFALSHGQVDRVIVGVTSPDELAEIVAAARMSPQPVPASLSSDDEDLVNPARWNSR